MEYMDKPPVPALPLDQANELVEQIKRDNLIKKRIQGLKSYDNCFAGDEVVQWLIKSGKAKDVEAALPIGQSLLDNRLAHHVTDDHTFKNEHLFYRLYSDEPANIQKEAALFEDRVSKAKLAGYLKLRSLHTFSSPTFFDCYVLLNYDESENTTTAAGASSPSGTSSKKQQKQPGVLSSIADSISSAFGGSSSSASADIDFEGKSFPGVLFVYKLRSAPVPFLRLQVKDCVCSMTECVNCLADNYCFTITTNQIESTRNAQFTLCAKNSKQAEAWMFAMQAGGLEFEKVEEGEVKAASLFELTANDLITNEVIPLSNFKGKVCLVVNVSSKCGLTPKNYPELVQLYKTYGPKGFVVLAFPTNQFANQEPGTPEEIRKFVDGYGVDFPMFAKINVNGSNAHPVFKFLKQNLGGVLGSSIKWNFTKFLCDRNGKPVKRYMPVTQPMSFVADIEALLEEEYKPSDN